MLLVLRVGLIFYSFLILGSISALLAVSLSGALALLTSLAIMSYSFKLKFWSLLPQLFFNRLVLGAISAFWVGSFLYGQLAAWVESNLPHSGAFHPPDSRFFWAFSRVFDTFIVWVGLMLILMIVLETWRVVFSRRPVFNYYTLLGVAVVLAFAVVACGEYLGLINPAWLSAVVAYVITVLLHIGGFKFESKHHRQTKRWQA